VARNATIAAHTITTWLKSLCHGCAFANQYAETAFMVELSGPSAFEFEEYERAFDQGVASRVPVVVVLSDIASQAELVRVLNALRQGDRWSVQKAPRCEWPSQCPVMVTWRTTQGPDSILMGLGPFLSMPPTRRAPYVALAMWPGGFDNKHRPNPGPSGRVRTRVALSDTDVSKMADTAYNKNWSRSETITAGHLGKIDPLSMLKMTFCLDAEHLVALSLDQRSSSLPPSAPTKLP
jgi:hypothetical protein